MKIFIIYDRIGLISDEAFGSFDKAVSFVASYLEQENNKEFYEDYDDRPAKMEREFTYKDQQGGVMVAYNELKKTSIFIKELIKNGFTVG